MAASIVAYTRGRDLTWTWTIEAPTDEAFKLARIASRLAIPFTMTPGWIGSRLPGLPVPGDGPTCGPPVELDGYVIELEATGEGFDSVCQMSADFAELARRAGLDTMLPTEERTRQPSA